MSYSIVGILAILIHLIINREALWNIDSGTDAPARKEYRAFLFGVMGFYLTDVLWGVFSELHLNILLFINTSIFFIVMMLSVMLWTRYVTAYLDIHNLFDKVLSVTGTALLAFAAGSVLVNTFLPILFTVDSNANYHAGFLRYVLYYTQIVLFLMSSVYSIAVSIHAQDNVKYRHLTISAFSIAMIVMLALQILFPLLPLYSIGYLLGICLIHTYVEEGYRREYREKLEDMLARERHREQELGTAKQKIYTDPLTGLGSKQAYLEHEAKLDMQIRNGAKFEMAVVVFDLNDLKLVNDTMGHETGDIFIYNAGLLISVYFSNSAVYRVGGDEFTAILEGEDYKNCESLLKDFDKKAEDNISKGKAVVSSGMSEYRYGKDKNYKQIFDRADKNMYLRKRVLKALKNHRDQTQVR